ncbi:hypothetical protein D3C80_947390 [compost metagenome]
MAELQMRIGEFFGLIQPTDTELLKVDLPEHPFSIQTDSLLVSFPVDLLLVSPMVQDQEAARTKTTYTENSIPIGIKTGQLPTHN